MAAGRQYALGSLCSVVARAGLARPGKPRAYDGSAIGWPRASEPGADRGVRRAPSRGAKRSIAAEADSVGTEAEFRRRRQWSIWSR
jgi:hypothetical protein